MTPIVGTWFFTAAVHTTIKNILIYPRASDNTSPIFDPINTYPARMDYSTETSGLMLAPDFRMEWFSALFNIDMCSASRTFKDVLQYSGVLSDCIPQVGRNIHPNRNLIVFSISEYTSRKICFR